MIVDHVRERLVTTSTDRDAAAGARWKGGSLGMVAGGLILASLVVMTVFAPMLASHDPLEQNIGQRLQRPSAEHVLGTDRLGRDIYSRLLYGGRTSLTTGLMVTAIAVSAGVPLGLLAGYYGGKVDLLTQRLVDIIMAFPGILLAIGIMAVLGQGLLNMIVAISIVNVPRLTRVTRGIVLQVREAEFVDAAKAMGARDRYLLGRHVVPASLGPITVQAAFTVVHAVRLEATLSFIGLGVPPPYPSWGGMLDDGKAYIQTLPLMIVSPGLAIALTILALSLMGEGLRDYLDPRTRAMARVQ